MVAGAMTAYVDESLRLDGRGLYVLAAVVVPTSRADEMRAALVDAVPPGLRRYHWRKERPESRSAMCAVIAGLGISAIATTAPVDPARQERARRRCLIALLWALDQRGVRDVVFESRRRRDALDAEMVRHVVRAGWVSADVRCGFATPEAEPLLWLPDVVAGAVRADGDGEPWLDLLRGVVTVEAAP